jgi:hypothetical protein
VLSATPAVSFGPGMSPRPPISAADSEPERAHADSSAWLSALRSAGVERDEAIARLHELLVRAARFEVSRRRAALSHIRGEELDDLALQAADDALVAVLAKLDDYRGASRFTKTLTFMPASTRSSTSRKATNSRVAGSPRKTTRSQVRAKPEYSMPTSYWSEKKYGRRS